ncbi:SDR family oxidoreductase [Microbacterium sp. JZ37]|uniref:SDR family oxidoreductase n=1 Tax=Microbacterium sp. JZ37 TaxID=2654193 RepID=UPI002B4A3156|nr:SDR family oxidoreductase [Microbacterium sp. JZ37]WRH18475.1 SDR family oxidoreductase [Microbacterium sp. JZ37]
MNSISDRVAIVTGGSGGIGGLAARRLASEGMDVVVHYGSNREGADEVVAAIEAAGGRAIAASADIAEEAEAKALFDLAEKEFGGVDVLVHTAGIMPLSPLEQLDLEVFDRVQRVNVRGTFVVDQLAAQRIRRGGAIINFSTSITRLQYPAYAAYAASKGAVEAITLILARELRGRDITVNAIAPGPTATPLFFEGKSQELIDQIAGGNPFQRLGTPEDIAEAVAFLAGPARWVNGQNIFVNGGAA